VKKNSSGHFSENFTFDGKNFLPHTRKQMKNNVTLFLLLFFASIHLMGQKNVPEGGRSAAMGTASVALADFWSLQNNQAGLAYFNTPAAGAYFENRFLVKELSLKSGGVVLPVNQGVFGVKLTYFGYSLYNENKIGVAYARKFSDYFAAGLQLNYMITSIGDDYGSKGVATFEAGLMSKVNPNLTIGAHVFNPINARMAAYGDERIPAVFRLGAAYSFDSNIMLTVEAEKETNFDPALKFGIEYKIIDEVFVRGGLSSNPGEYSFGVGLNLNKIIVDFSSSMHHVLGYSPQISMIYNFR
jgi:hypothetical protein